MSVGTPRCLESRARAVAVTLVLAALAGCYKPNITDNGFRCSATGACPEGFKCGADQRCSLNPVVSPQDAGIEVKPVTDAMMDAIADAGVEAAPMCMAPPALCADGPAGSDVCSPSCQKGCACGRCNVVDGKAACVTAGAIKLGDVCNPNADNCEAGLICLLETCGNGLARCYRHCTTGAQCDRTACTIPIEANDGSATSFATCDVPIRDCNPLATGDSTCPDPALNCYLTNTNQTLCDCPTRPAIQGGNNAECSLYSECAAGFICISGVDKQTTPHCHFVCRVGGMDCPAGAHCVSLPTAGAKYGYCELNI